MADLFNGRLAVTADAAGNLPGLVVGGTDKRYTKRGEQVIWVDDYLTDDTPAGQTSAWKAAIDAAKLRARTKVGELYYGLPTIQCSPRDWTITETLQLKSINGLTVRCSGANGARMITTTGIPIWEITHAAHLTFEGMTIQCGATAPQTDGLVENSSAVWLHEAAGESIPGSITAIRFTRVLFQGFHRAIYVTGNQMGDNVTFDQCRWSDNFYDVDMQNGQAVNWRFLGGEFVGFLTATEAAYNARLALWSSASVPASAKAGQFQNPAATSGTVQDVTVRDGAVFRVVAGGEFHVDDRASFVILKTLLLFASVPTTGAQDSYGTGSNALQFIVEGATGELRATDAVGDRWGHQRVSLTRWELPYAAQNVLATVSPQVLFQKCRWTVNPSGMDIVHVAGPCAIRWQDTRVIGATGAGNVRLCHVSGGITYGSPGSFLGERSTILTQQVTVKDSAGADSSAVPGVATHWVRQSGMDHGGARAYDSTAPILMASRNQVNNRPSPVQVYQFANTDGSLFGASLNAVGATKTFQVGLGYTVRRVGVTISSLTSGTASPVTLRFKDSAGTVYGEVTADWAAASPTVSATANGVACNGSRRAYADVGITPGDGKVIVEVVSKTAAVMQGFAWVEVY